MSQQDRDKFFRERGPEKRPETEVVYPINGLEELVVAERALHVGDTSFPDLDHPGEIIADVGEN